MRCFICLAVVVSAPILIAEPTNFVSASNQATERTCFQTGEPFSGYGDIGADVAIVYGIGKKLPDRVQSWRARGYHVQMMTGSAWGGYADYLDGKYDGTKHWDEVQTDRNGKLHAHGGHIVYYMCPSTNFGNYLCDGIQRALDSNVEAIYLEEPEYIPMVSSANGKITMARTGSRRTVRWMPSGAHQN